jgi:hypothetical protein
MMIKDKKPNKSKKNSFNNDILHHIILLLYQSPFKLLFFNYIFAKEG